MTTVRAIIKDVSTHWISVTSTRRLVIMVGTAILIDPIMMEWVSDPRKMDKLIAHGALALVERVAVLAGRRRAWATCASFLPLHSTASLRYGARPPSIWVSRTVWSTYPSGERPACPRKKSHSITEC